MKIAVKKLKPCPFCGNKNIMLCGGDDILSDGGGYWYIVCLVCGCTIYGSESRTKVIDSWNRRVSDERTDQRL